MRDKTGKTFGVLCAISRNRLDLPPKTEEVFSIIAARSALEIERKQAEKKISRLAKFPRENPNPVPRF